MLCHLHSIVVSHAHQPSAHAQACIDKMLHEMAVPCLPGSLTCRRPLLAQVKARQLREQNPYLGIDCNDVGTNDMREQNVFETLSGKKQQLFLATQVCKMILKIDDVIQPTDYE